jgi:hypothetical protein
MDATTPRLDRASQLRLPYPDEFVDISYALYAADDTALDGKEVQKDAKRVVENFRGLKADNDVEKAYLSCAHAIVVAHAKALARRRARWEADLKEAVDERDRAVNHMRESSVQNAWWPLVWKLMPVALMVITGIAVAQNSGKIPEDSTKLMTWMMSFAVGILFAIVGRYVGVMFRDLRRGFIEAAYRAQKSEIERAYEQGKMLDQDYFRDRLSEKWKQYTGEAYPVKGSYKMVIEGDIAARERLEQRRMSFSSSGFRLLRRLGRILRGRKRSGEKVQEKFTEAS